MQLFSPSLMDWSRLFQRQSLFPMRRGNFEDLTLYVGMAFDRQNEEALSHLSATDGMGIFVWLPHVVQMLEKTPWNGLDMRNKQLNMISFMFELLYDRGEVSFIVRKRRGHCASPGGTTSQRVQGLNDFCASFNTSNQ